MSKALLLVTAIILVFVPSFASCAQRLSDEEMREVNKDPDAKWFIQHDAYDEKFEAWKATGLKYKDTFDRSLLPKLTDSLNTVIDQWASVYQRWQRVRIEHPRGLGHELGKNEVEYEGKSTCQAMLLTAKSFAVTPGMYTKEDKETAKKIYRQLVTTFTGQAYEGFVRTARFELEDLK